MIERKALKEKLARLPLRLCATAGAVYGRRGLRQRLAVNAKVQEGDQPQEDPRELLIEVEETLTALQRLIVQINRTNIETVLREGERATLMDAIAQRDVLAIKREILQLAVNAATITRERQGVKRARCPDPSAQLYDGVAGKAERMAIGVVEAESCWEHRRASA